ncbi:MAG: Obg family GTPase CgtA, partial [Lachnospiraceae bacterium]|nr:Obg family GTPase CgtA [Lachnospiraceae bacterium]
YDPRLAQLPQVIAANKTDLFIYDTSGADLNEADLSETDLSNQADLNEAVAGEDGTVKSDPIEQIRRAFEPVGYKVFPISAVSGQGINELLYHVRHLLDALTDEPFVFAPEYFPEDILLESDEPYTVVFNEATKEYVVEGPRIEKMLGYTNLEAEKGFVFFQRFLKQSGILAELERLGIQEKDTVRMYGLSFEYYK